MKLPFELQNGETVLLFTRRHPVYLISKFVALILLLIVPIVVVLVLTSKTAGLGGLAGKIVMLLAVLWAGYLLCAYFLWYRFKNDVWIVTNQRIVDSLKNHWFHHQIASADLVNVEDMAVNRSGLLQTAFKFGDLRCQTAGVHANFVLAGIPHPTNVLAIVDASRDAARRELGQVPGRITN